uniref:Abi-like protein n=1 Tax=Candidatus Kentrum sp. LPFa TaxID=2126335 RepID=A0A450W644_9GAMM|nr:MAG: Abi-like protein [Candidatus Kentron sp. LPFa]
MITIETFQYNDEVADALRISLSQERMGRYLEASDGSWEKAFHLYTWNTAISAAFYESLQGLEVTLRNAIHQRLSKIYSVEIYGISWYDNPEVGLDAWAIGRIKKARDTLDRHRRDINPSSIVAELPLGFWVSLLSRGGKGPSLDRKMDYNNTLWKKGLWQTFPHCKERRREIYKRLHFLQKFRNRIAHHEPIFRRDLKADFSSILGVTAWICPITADWIERHSRVRELLYCRKRGDMEILF